MFRQSIAGMAPRIKRLFDEYDEDTLERVWQSLVESYNIVGCSCERSSQYIPGVS